MAHKLIIFAEPITGFAPSLLDSFLNELKGRSGIDSVKICVTSKDRPRLLLAVGSLLKFLVKTLFNPHVAGNFARPKLATVTTVAKKHGTEILKVPQYNINDPAFIRELKAGQPTLALSLGCVQIWGPALLGIFDLAVNFHHGYLPDYKGLWATQWSVYRGEEHSGYAFHVMDEGIDTGPIICRGRVPIRSDASPAGILRVKQRAARKDVGKVLDVMISGHFESLVQPKGGSYFSGKDYKKTTIIGDPTKLTAKELHRRVQCFALLKMQFEGVYYPVTSLRLAGRKRKPLSFVTADDVELYPDRLWHVPTRLYLAAHSLKALKDIE